jgi:hypothetical protein
MYTETRGTQVQKQFKESKERVSNPMDVDQGRKTKTTGNILERKETHLTEFQKKSLLKETSASALSKMVQAALTGKGKCWTYIIKPAGGDLLYCQYDNQEFYLERVVFEPIAKFEEYIYTKDSYTLIYKDSATALQVFDLSAEEYFKVREKIDAMVKPIIERHYSLNNDLGLTRLFDALIHQTVELKLDWKRVDITLKFRGELAFDVTDAYSTELNGATKIVLLPKNESRPVACMYISAEGKPAQLLKVSTQKEYEKYRVLENYIISMLD